MSSGNLVADKRADYARMLGDAGDFQASAELMRQALELAPEWAAGWYQAGGYFEKAGDFAAAATAFERTLAASPGDRFGARLKLAHLRGEALPEPQTDYVEALFDDYADRFDKSLVGKLGYRVPELLSEMIVRAEPKRVFRHCVDLGCGTGLMASALGKVAETYTGIDLSAAMLAKAEGKGLYRKLIKADLIDGLSEAGPADLIVAADVFMYFGSLEPVVKAAAKRLAPDGLFAFSVELSASAGDFELRQSLRHAHSSGYVDDCLSEAGFQTLSRTTANIRMDGTVGIEGLLVIAGKPKNADG